MANLVKKIIKAAGKDAVLNKKLPAAYRRGAARPVEPGKVLFVSASSPAPTLSFGLIMPRLAAMEGMSVSFVGLGKGKVAWGEYVRNCERFAEDAATAQLIFLDDSSDVVSCLPLRLETRVIQLWHACGAFKKWGMATVGLEHGVVAEEFLRHPGYENLSLVTVSSPEVVWAYAEAMNLVGREQIIQPLGISRTDVFFDEGHVADARRRLLEAFPAIGGRKVILYAPTFRGHPLSATSPDELDIPLLRARFGGECALVIVQHPFVAGAWDIPADCADFAFEARGIEGLGTNELMCAADLLVTDYSSVIFEFALLGRPMAFLAADRAEYDDWRGFFYPYEEMTPGPIATTTGELADAIEGLLGSFDPAEVEAFRARFMSACDGHATDRIIAFALGA